MRYVVAITLASLSIICAMLSIACSRSGDGAGNTGDGLQAAYARSQPETTRQAIPDVALVLARDVESYFEDCGCSGSAKGGVSRYPFVHHNARSVTFGFVGRTILPDMEKWTDDQRSAFSEQATQYVEVAYRLFDALENVIWWLDDQEFEELESFGFDLSRFDRWICRSDSSAIWADTSLTIRADYLKVDACNFEVALPKAKDRGRRVQILYKWQALTEVEEGATALPRLGAYIPLIENHSEARTRVVSILEDVPSSHSAFTSVYRNVHSQIPQSKEILSLLGDQSVRRFHGANLLQLPIKYNVESLQRHFQECRDCHADAVEQWVGSRHYLSYRTLLSSGKSDDLRCLTCHVQKIDARGIPVESALAVTCASCHQKGRDPSDVCADCHTPLTDPGNHFLKRRTDICCKKTHESLGDCTFEP